MYHSHQNHDLVLRMVGHLHGLAAVGFLEGHLVMAIGSGLDISHDNPRFDIILLETQATSGSLHIGKCLPVIKTQGSINEATRKRNLRLVVDSDQQTVGHTQLAAFPQQRQVAVVLVDITQLLDTIFRLKGILLRIRTKQLVSLGHQIILSLVARGHHFIFKSNLNEILAVKDFIRETFHGIVATSHVTITLIDFRPYVRLSGVFQSLDALMIGLVGIMVRSSQHIDMFSIFVTLTDFGRKSLNHLIILLGFKKFLGCVACRQHRAEQHDGNESENLHCFLFLV